MAALVVGVDVAAAEVVARVEVRVNFGRIWPILRHLRGDGLASVDSGALFQRRLIACWEGRFGLPQRNGCQTSSFLLFARLTMFSRFPSVARVALACRVVRLGRAAFCVTSDACLVDRSVVD